MKIAFAGNGSSIAIVISALASAARVPTYTFCIGARNNGGRINSTTPRQYSDAWIGAGLNGVQFASFRSDAGLPAFGAPVNLTIFLAEHSCVVMLPLRLPCDHD